MSIVALNHVEMSYPRKNRERFYALEQLSIEVNQGEVFCLLGPNGSGKTTTINLINGLSRPTRGDVRVFGLDPAKEMRTVRRKLSVVPQETALYNDLTAKENLLFHAQYYGIEKRMWTSQIGKLLELVGLSERQNDRVGTYSGGMQRRLALARALLTSPDLILLDEPTLGVDVQSRNSIWTRIRELTGEGKTVFLTTNYMEEADSLADRIVIIDRGSVVASGSPQQLKERITDNSMALIFERENDARTTFVRLGGKCSAVLEANKVLVNVADKKTALRMLKSFDAENDGLISFEWKEPTLNDVFLHFTGRQLRN
ncbi:MAG: ATP-binding cassette domain-containing protein [Paenibacillus macerans]|uniref:ABC transporter family protein n=1 Tax=Paenibacillus macerans TaxID=44252 RepID=A0A091A498_PAEMA|nr:ATP-binding cassette domain-containing protein [Paenibacillus macerans]KFN11071.1 ABC transporter family protein [Paenibacillus macerans]MBS5912891.1 ATP-binding cassette domain-containing protein [Paenibacillus macerans]MCY7562640.1 ATP-binding cassette domain-containing protein [Paenibacillus macerans]MDU7476516.1 ATP-binding cassette domain-containing protein [Paenibacillus macerans]MEC0140346.1 ATP-binding cassette domain-containing protein [Paenibacillus macerans]